MKHKKSISICRWAAEDIPSEKAWAQGFQSLSNAELLSIIIGSGTANENAVDLTRRLLAESDNSLRRLYKMRKDEITAINGIGSQKATKIQAALELANRMNMERAMDNPELITATRIYNYMKPRIGMLDAEEFWALYLNQSFRLIQSRRISCGGISEVAVDIRLILREALLCHSTVLVACHNHPSGSITPSRVDNELTKSIKMACDTMRIKFMDHIIVSESYYYSYHENGYL